LYCKGNTNLKNTNIRRKKMEILNNNILTTIKELDTQNELINKTTQKLLDKLEIYYELKERVDILKSEILNIKESLTNCDISELSTIEILTELLLDKIRTLNDINESLKQYNDSNLKILNSKINHNFNLNIKNNQEMHNLLNSVIGLDNSMNEANDTDDLIF